MTAAMTARPHQSLPKQCPGWADLKAAYRLLSNPAVDPQALQQPHRQHVRERCAQLPVVLCVQDTSDLDFTGRTGIKHLGKTGNGRGRGILQHTALAVRPDDGVVLGVLHQSWHARVEQPKGETRAQRRARWRESQVWADTVAAVAAVGAVGAAGAAPGGGCRLIHVGDRHSDVWETFEAVEAAGPGVGFVVRAMHDRRLETSDADKGGGGGGGDGDGGGGGDEDDDEDAAVAALWPTLQARPVAATFSVDVGAQRNGRGTLTRVARRATVSVRFAPVTLAPPAYRGRATPPRPLWAVYVREDEPPPGVTEPLEWMLLTDEPLADAADALRVVGYYQRRWVIEEFHRVEKEGCRLEQTQLDDAADVARLAAVTAVLAVRLLQLRDAARADAQAADAQPADAQAAEAQAAEAQASGADTPAALATVAPPSWIAVVATLARVKAAELTPTLFWRTLARRGGHIGRRSDGPPGWKTIWRGVYDVQLMAEGYEQALGQSGCG
jgi:hypothetical protein